MNRHVRGVWVFFLSFLMIAAAAQADLSKVPDRNTFSMGYSRLQKAIQKGEAITWSASIVPGAAAGVPEGALEVFQSIVGALELSGVLQCEKDGSGWLQAIISSEGNEIASFEQMAKDGRVGLNLNGVWVSTAADAQEQAAYMLTLDDLGQSLFSLDYESLRSGDVPFLSSLEGAGLSLWALSGPYSTDNNNLRVSSGPTSHGTTIEVDTAAARSILKAWADELESSRGAESIGLSGTDFYLGISEAEIQRLIGKVRQLSNTVELHTPIKVNMAFGEGDLLQSAKGSGTLAEDGKRTNIAYTYACTPKTTRMTRKYSLDFQPRNGDTIVLNCTTVTSSNGKTSGASEFSLSASGVYDGLPYKIKINSEMLNQFALDGEGLLREDITGTVTANITYDGQTVLDIALARDGFTESSLAGRALTVQDTLTGSIADSQGVLFQGEIRLAFGIGDTPLASPDMETTQYLEAMDFMEVESLRGALQTTLAEAKQNLLAALPMQTLTSLLELQ